MGRAETWNQPFLAFTALACVMATRVLGATGRGNREGDALARAQVPGTS